MDERLASSCLALAEWPLSRVLLKNTTHYPWLILVPRRAELTEISDLSRPELHLLIDEIAELSKIMQNYFKPDKLNVGSLGNIVPQLHIHLIARFSHDPSWPFGVWQNNALPDEPYADPDQLTGDLRGLIQKCFLDF